MLKEEKSYHHVYAAACLDILLLSQKSIEHPCNDARDLPTLKVRKGNLYNHP